MGLHWVIGLVAVFTLAGFLFGMMYGARCCLHEIMDAIQRAGRYEVRDSLQAIVGTIRKSDPGIAARVAEHLHRPQ